MGLLAFFDPDDGEVDLAAGAVVLCLEDAVDSGIMREPPKSGRPISSNGLLLSSRSLVASARMIVWPPEDEDLVGGSDDAARLRGIAPLPFSSGELVVDEDELGSGDEEGEDEAVSVCVRRREDLDLRAFAAAGLSLGAAIQERKESTELEAARREEGRREGISDACVDMFGGRECMYMLAEEDAAGRECVHSRTLFDRACECRLGRNEVRSSK